MSSRIHFDSSHRAPSEENEEVVFFKDRTIRVTQKVILIGSPYNQAFAIPQIIGVSYSKEKETITTLFRIIIGGFALVCGVGFIANKSYVLGGVLAAFGLFKLKKALTFAWFVSLQFNGLGNQTLIMKSRRDAIKLCNAITLAISQMPPPPPSGGESVAYQPYFPSPVNSRN